MKQPAGLFDDEPAGRPSDPEPDPAADGGRPLAERMRPTSLDQVVGQEALVAPGAPLRRALESGRLFSTILWGPPGTGKTTLARLLATESGATFIPFSAVTTGIKEIREVMSQAQRLRRAGEVILFVDEIHRFNRAQQDAFLPYVERGDVVLVGATTENPSFELNGALLSRCRVLVLEPLEPEAVRRLLERALEDRARGLGSLELELADEALEAIVQLASGDARRALGTLEVVADLVVADGRRLADAEDVRRSVQRRTLLYDKAGEEHFNLISALHKSLRESDADAAVYWLLRMLEAGEDPGYVARRMLRFASEDVGLADPRALDQALAGWQAYDRLGSPEGELALVQVAVYLALAPKSVGVYRAEKTVRRVLQERAADPVPAVIRNAPTRLMKDVGYGRGYIYAPDTEEGVGGLECLPEALRGERYYRPGERGFERELRRRLEEIEEARRRARANSDDPDPSSTA